MRRSLAIVAAALLAALRLARRRSSGRGRSRARPRRRPPGRRRRRVDAAEPAKARCKFAVLGDFGNGQAAAVRARRADGDWSTTASRSSSSSLVGDNIYGSRAAAGLRQTKFELPYKALLDKGVKFYATLGNHDSREQRYYKLFNMDGKLYYTFKAPKQDVRFFALESTYMDPDQMKWLENELKKCRRRVEDRLLPPSALFVGRSGTARQLTLRDGARAAVRPVQRQRRAHRPRPLLRADQAAERDRVLRRRARAASCAAANIDTGSPLTAFGNDTDRPSWSDGDRRRQADLQRHLTDRRGHRLRRDHAPEAG